VMVMVMPLLDNAILLVQQCIDSTRAFGDSKSWTQQAIKLAIWTVQ
jgi:hypothetical protein